MFKHVKDKEHICHHLRPVQPSGSHLSRLIAVIIDCLQSKQNSYKSNLTAGTVQVEPNLQEELSVHLHFTKVKCC